MATPGYVLMVQGDGVTADWEPIVYTEALPSASVEAETTWGIVPDDGDADTFAKGDHTHGTPADPIPPHAAVTSSVHGFDGSGNAPAQTHGTSRHTGTIGSWSQIDKTVSSLADLTTRSAAALSSGTLDGDRLPAMSAAKRGGTPPTGVPSGKFLRDDDTWQAAGGGTGSAVDSFAFAWFA